MARSPYCAEGVALARQTLADSRYLAGLSPADRSEIIGLAFDILRKDRAARLGLDPAAAQGPARVIAIPRAVFQAGPGFRHRLNLVRPRPGTPGDAA
jgi:hypothetical protein